ncbi:MAG TPA: HAMP domain-containing protein [Thiolapillus brandeum]|uniref:histidine kinase n=1 Tax=Thiolapillus brandeum TaxID=1076588 RepID=A0A831RWF0_9GAMM|nr:HAMP domain-containing protein [Thiolapillus brandeum]
MKFTHTLKFQIGIALLALIALFSFFSMHTLKILDEQRTQGALLRLAGELQATAQHMAMQAMNYEKNTPQDTAAYTRDLRLYYQDLMNNTGQFDDICAAFSSGDFQRQLEIHEPMNPVLSENTLDAAYELEDYWKKFMLDLDKVMGPDKMPHLADAAKLIVDRNPELLQKTRNLLKALDEDIQQRTRETNIIIRASFAVALIIAIGIMLWFYRQVLRPLSGSAEGFRQASAGNFSYRMPVTANNEIGFLALSFNQLSSRLNSLFKLTARLQEGSDLNETLEFVSHTFPELLPLDWVGVLFVSTDGQIQLERAYSDGVPEELGILRFPLKDTLLEQCLNSGEPLHIPDIQEVAQLSSSYRFLQVLTDRQRRDAIFLPVTSQSPIPGVLVFATRQAHAYGQEHTQLLSNLATVITLSFSRTLKLAEHARLAAIGQFVSDIAHEIRTPLATVSMALDYFENTELPEAAHKRLLLAEQEMARINRLLADILLYARPLTLKTESTDLCLILEKAIASRKPQAETHKAAIALDCPEDTLPLHADPDRLLQIFLNLLGNAIEATTANSAVTIRVRSKDTDKVIQVDVTNRGDPIAPENLEHLFEPFFTTKANGTGLGLAIVRRLVQAHGGSVAVTSDTESGTTFTVRIPRML